MERRVSSATTTQTEDFERIQVLRIPYNHTFSNDDSNSDQPNLDEYYYVPSTWEEVPEGSYSELNNQSESVSIFTLDIPQEINNNSNIIPDESLHDNSKINRGRLKLTRILNKTNRPQSAPARPLSELEEFRESLEFSYLESIIVIMRLIPRVEKRKLDFESSHGHYLCNKLLENIEYLSHLLSIQPLNRKYRHKFSKPYRVFYPNTEDYIYLPEILNSAQERISYVIINGEKYVFSSNIIHYGEQLFFSFIQLSRYIRDVYSLCCEEGFNSIDVMPIIQELKVHLIYFDKCWVRYERVYVFELMIIENDSKRLIVKAINIEQKIKNFETTEKLKGNLVIRSSYYDTLRLQFIEICGKINSITNYIGKGRDDLSFEILVAAENVIRKISDNKSRAIRKLGLKIKEVFDKLRSLLRKYSEDIEMLDPELCNNMDLVEMLVEFEKTWEKGKYYLLDNSIKKMFVDFSQLIEGLSEKYQEVRDKFEAMDADVFLIVPSLAILRSFEDKGEIMYNLYYPELRQNSKDAEEFRKLKEMYNHLKKKKGEYKIYKQIEETILERDITKNEEIKKLVHEIKRSAILLQRSKPSDWNLLMETAMGII